MSENRTTVTMQIPEMWNPRNYDLPLSCWAGRCCSPSV